MENEEMSIKLMKVEIPPEPETTTGQGGLTRQGSIAKNNCLCSPTTHAGSFRCRLHRTPTLQRTKSTDTPSLTGNSHPKSDSTTVEAAQ